MANDKSPLEVELGKLQAYIVAGFAFALVLAVSFVAVATWQAARQSSDRAALARVATETHAALCTFKADLQRRYDDGVSYLKGHPEGVLGISAEQIQQSLNNQKATLVALASLECV